MVVQLYVAAGGVLALGFLWFYIARPILVSAGVIRDGEVSSDTAAPPRELMSSDACDAAPSLVSDHRPDLRPRDETPETPKATDEQFLTLFAVFKEAGYNREEARAILRPFRVPVDNNLFSRAPKPADPLGDPRINVPAYEQPPR